MVVESDSEGTAMTQSASTDNPSNSTENGGAVKSIPLDGRLDNRRNLKKEPRPFEELPPELQAVLNDKGRRTVAKSSIEILEGKYVLRILLYLDKMSPVLKTDIYNDLSRSAGMSDKIEELHQLGLLEMYSTSRANACVVVITDKGRKVVEIIREMVEMVDQEEEKEKFRRW